MGTTAVDESDGGFGSELGNFFPWGIVGGEEEEDDDYFFICIVSSASNSSRCFEDSSTTPIKLVKSIIIRQQQQTQNELEHFLFTPRNYINMLMYTNTLFLIIV